MGIRRINLIAWFISVESLMILYGVIKFIEYYVLNKET
jgi:hypothetical protein